MKEIPVQQSSLILYRTEDGQTRIECRFEEETLWLTQALIAELYQRDVRTISEHIKNIFEEGELEPDSVVRKFRITAGERLRSIRILHTSIMEAAIVSISYKFKMRSVRAN
jgi:hypothetical protein